MDNDNLKWIHLPGSMGGGFDPVHIEEVKGVRINAKRKTKFPGSTGTN